MDFSTITGGRDDLSPDVRQVSGTYTLSDRQPQGCGGADHRSVLEKVDRYIQLMNDLDSGW